MAWLELLEASRTALIAGRYRESLQLCDKAATESEEARYQSALMRGDVLLQMGDAAGALSSFESIADLSKPDADVDLARGVALFELGRLPEADNALRSATRENAECAEAHHTLGLIAEFFGSGEEVEFFRTARRLEPDRFPARKQLTRLNFEAVVEQALAQLPGPIRDATRNIPVLVAELPNPADLHRGPIAIPPTALGLFVSANQEDGKSVRIHGVDAPAILLFKRNLERAFPDADDLVAALRKTILHEIGLALGLTELEMRRRGLE